MSTDKPDFKELTSGLAVAHLYRRYQPPEFFAIHEMQIGNHQRADGRWQDRRADFVAMRLWGNGHSSGLGFEIKTSRADFMKELQDPTKRRPMEELCSACYFVAPRGLFTKDELPEGWGWLELQKRGLRMQKEAQHKKTPENLSFIHSCMKRMLDIRWYDRSRKPAVLDFPQRIWELEGRCLTNGQLHALMLETFFEKRDTMLAQAKREALKEAQDANAKDLERLNALERMIGEVTGAGYWHGRPIPIEQIKKDLQVLKMGRDNKTALDALTWALRDAEHHVQSLKRRLDELTPPTEGHDATAS